MRTRSVVTSFVCTLVWLGVARPALAQRVNGPYAGAFGAQPDESRTQGLDLSGSVFGAYDLNRLPEPAAPDPRNPLDPRLNESGSSGGAYGQLTYERRGDRTQFVLAGGGSARGYASHSGVPVLAYQAGASLTREVASKLVLEARGGAGYSPFIQFAPSFESGRDSVEPTAPAFGFAAAAERNIVMNASLGLTSNVTKRTSLFASASTGDSWMLDAPAGNFGTWGGTWGARAGVRHRLGRGLGLHLEYGQDHHEYASAGSAPYVHRTIDAGVDYADALTFARRATLSFSTSTTATRSAGETHYRLNGSVRLSRAFNRTWSTWVGYNRATEFRIGFSAPLLSDSVETGLAGLFSWRAQWSAGAGYTRGMVGFGPSDFTTYIGVSRLDFALTRKIAVFGQYTYYHDLPPGSSALNFIPRFSRQVATVGLSLYLPLLHGRASESQRP